VKGPASHAPREWAGRVLLAAAALTTAAFFASGWGINAEGWGARDAGLALSLSFANALALYGSAGISALAAMAALYAVVTRRRWRFLACAALVALLPLAFLAVRDAF
jgi:hypothetical protein